MPVGVEPKFTTHYTHPVGDCAIGCGSKVYSIHSLLPINSYSFQLHYTTDNQYIEPLGLFCMFRPSTSVQ